MRDLERAIREVPEVPALMPSWAGVEHRQQQDNANRFQQLRRKTRPTDAEQAELDRLNRDREPVTTLEQL